MPASSFHIDTEQHEQFIDITDSVAHIAAETHGAGAVVVNCLHTTAAITVNEGADPDVADDLIKVLKDLARFKGYKHAEGNSDAHLKASLLGASQVIPISNGRLQLGRWQRIFLCEFDGPRKARMIVVTPLSGA